MRRDSQPQLVVRQLEISAAWGGKENSLSVITYRLLILFIQDHHTPCIQKESYRVLSTYRLFYWAPKSEGTLVQIQAPVGSKHRLHRIDLAVSYLASQSQQDRRAYRVFRSGRVVTQNLGQGTLHQFKTQRCNLLSRSSRCTAFPKTKWNPDYYLQIFKWTYIAYCSILWSIELENDSFQDHIPYLGGRFLEPSIDRRTWELEYLYLYWAAPWGAYFCQIGQHLHMTGSLANTWRSRCLGPRYNPHVSKSRTLKFWWIPK